MATRVSDEPLWSAASRSSNREPAASGMACDPQTEKQTRVLVFGATRKTRRRTFQYYQNRASAPARLQIQRAQIQSAIKHHTFKWYFFVNIVCPAPDRLVPFRSHHGLSPVRPTHSVASATCRERRRLFRRVLYGHRTSISGTIKLNGIFKMVCASVCWIFPERDESCIRDGLHAFGRQAEIPTWPN